MKKIIVTAFATSIAAFLLSPQHASAQATNLIVSRQVYQDTGAIANLHIGDLLPNGTPAVATGSYYDVGTGNNIWMNEKPDASFGVTAPIWLDNVNPQNGTRTSSLNVTDSLINSGGTVITNSFPSKSELGLHLTPDGTGVTFMSYVAPVGAIDVSNANTTQANDNTNPVTSVGLVPRAIGQVSLSNGQVQNNSSITVTQVNAYGGNNGRNAVLGADGKYYMVGNAGNGGWKVEVNTTAGSNLLSLTSAAATGSSTNPAGSSFTYDSTTPSTAGLVVGQAITATGIPSIAFTSVNTTSGSATVTVNSTTNLQTGMLVSGGGVAAGTTVASIVDSTHFTLSQAAIATGSSTGNAYSTVASIVDATHFTINENATVTNTNSTGVAASVVQNGSTLTQLSNATGIQLITPGSVTGNTTTVGVQKGLTGSPTGYNNGFSTTDIGFATADKTGKDDNFRGLTINPFNNTIYVSKGSGGNGINTIYQVGSGGLPGAAGAASTSLTIPNGLPANLATNGKNAAGVVQPTYSPFGIWFGAANVMYVGDEGSVSAATGGLQKWINSASNGTGTWSLAYTLTLGLNLGVAFQPAGLAAALDPANAGLRNIDGTINADGTVTIYGVTSTTSLNTDQGADPNQLVAITDSLAAQTLTSGSFTVLETAAAGEVIRGVAAVVPEPSTWTLLVGGMGSLLMLRRRR